ncbi:hypothetical protein [Flavobacterium coralii]|uniref:hypothetical protein n=1 Tax=Flavobacterium coralii TaxID=2838017 RepID=UPI000C4AB41D|nr:hypothetical protein [Flavobacterium sp.]|tara:strand:- start:20342 stop:20779 length:438 start_codon:yes stop_codon:yes gene_type:complete
MSDIVRIFETVASEKGYEYHYGKKAALNLLGGSLDADKTYLLHEFTNRKSNYNSSGTAITGITYEGKMFLVKQSNLDQQYFQERGEQDSSKYNVNIEPLLDEFKAIGNMLACSGYEVMQWDNIDVTDALDVNMDGILISYKVKVI